MNDIRNTPLGRLIFLSALSGGAAPVERTATGNPLTFETDLARPLKSLIANFLPVQSGTGDPSPTNIRPITGWTGLDVWHGGKNLFDVSSYPFTASRRISGEDGGDGSNSSYKATLDFIPCEDIAGKTVTLNKRPSGNIPGIGFYSSPSVSDFVSGLKNAHGTAGAPWTFTIPSNAKYMRFTVLADETEIQIEFGSTATEYEPYQPITAYPVTWTTHGTVYGGYVDLVTGEVWGTWEEIASYDGETLPGRWLSDRDVYSAGSTPTTGAQVVYELATPTLITTLTPQQINAIKGNNTVWSDGNGDCEVDYLISAGYADSHPVGGLGSGLLGFGSGNPDPDEPGEPDDNTGDDQPGNDQPEEP